MNDFFDEKQNNDISEGAAEEPQTSAPEAEPVSFSEPEAEAPSFTEEAQQSYQEIPADDGGFEQGYKHEAPAWNRVNYSDVSPINDYKPASKGLKIFAGLMAGIILLTGTCVAGYFLGRSSVSSGGTGEAVKVDLAARPKDTDQMTAAQVYEKVNESIVGIRVYNSAGAVSDASGVIYTEDGYVVTNDHIYSEIGAPQFRVYTYDGTEYDATYVAGDAISDLAVLKIEDGKDFTVTEFGDSSELFCGESVVAVGRPNDATDSSSITGGMISLPKRRVQTTSSYSARLIQTDSAINPGSSGGALINMYGQIVGITSSKLAGVEYDAVGFAIPTTTVKRVVEQLIEHGQVKDRAKLGISYTELDSVAAAINGFEDIGLYVAAVSEDSDIYGKVVEGDIITHINGTEITNDDIVLDILEDCRAGDTVTLTVVSEKNGISDYEVTLKANIGESSYTENIAQSSDSGESSGGGTFDFPFGE